MYKLLLSLVMTFCTMLSWAEDVVSIASAQNNQNVCPQIVEKESNSYLHGDINYDGIVNVNDISQNKENKCPQMVIKKSNSYLHGDINYDGAVNVNDISALVEIILNGDEGGEGGEGGEGDDSRVYLKCPDNHHPHVIDLGLPSGTKWCCCNVGAATPEAYGGYYAWGETSEKSVYNQVTYKYCTGEDIDGDGLYDRNLSYKNIGSDIAGTQYDVAHVRMGGSWRMPSFGQQSELTQYCTHSWIQLNGVDGILVTGKNGGQIFFPASGFRYQEDLYFAGWLGGSWSSSSCQDADNSEAIYLYLHDIDGLGGIKFESSNDQRIGGYPVRAVCP